MQRLAARPRAPWIVLALVVLGVIAMLPIVPRAPAAPSAPSVVAPTSTLEADRDWCGFGR